MPAQRALNLADERATIAAGENLAAAIARGGIRQCVIYLKGELGAGKTTFARGVLAGFGHRGRVPSPTYTLIEPYELADRIVQHIDLYRLEDPGEVIELGIAELAAPGVCLLVEWPERGAGALPEADLEVALSLSQEGRNLTYTANSATGAAFLSLL